MASFQNQVVVITGSGGGLGRATALAFAKEGAKVMVSDIVEEGGHETVALIQKAGGTAAFYKANVAHYHQVEKLIAVTVEHFGRLDIAVNNAGIGGGQMARLVDISLVDYQKTIDVNLSGVFYCMQTEIRQMLAQGGGKIVNVASVAGLRPLPNASVYSATKHAVVGLTKTAAIEYARKNIRINAVCPVFTHSAMVQSMFDQAPELEQKLVKTIPMGRYGQPEDVAQAVLWLCSEQNSFLTGHALPIDGGSAAV